MTMVLHTHNRKLDFHPHIHVIAPGGGVDKRRHQWKKIKGKYLFNEFAIAKVFRAIYRICRYTGLVQQPDKIVVRCAHTIYPYSFYAAMA